MTTGNILEQIKELYNVEVVDIKFQKRYNKIKFINKINFNNKIYFK